MRWNVRGLFVVGSAGLLAALVAAGCSSSDETPPRMSSPSELAEAQLQQETGVPWVVDIDPRSGAPDFVMPIGDPAAYVRPGEAHEAAALRFLDDHKSLFGIDAAAGQQLVLEDKDVDPSGLVHVRFAQVERGVRVFGCGYDVHFTATGAIAYVGGDFIPKLGSQTTAPARDEAAAFAAAQKAIPAGANLTKKTARVAFLPYAGGSGPGATALTHEFVLAGDANGRPFAARIFIDAKSGALVRRIEMIHKENVMARGTRAFPPISDANGTQSIRVRKVGAGPALEMVSAEKGTLISTRAASNVGTPIVSANGVDWDPIPAGTDGAGAAVDAHAHAAEVDDWFREKLRWKGYDNKSSPLKLIVHDNSAGAENAFWDSVDALHFGDGTAVTGGNLLPATGIGTMGHELGHGVTQYTAGLVYQGQSGALNESASDVFAACIYHDRRGADPFKLFAEEALDGQPLRDMLHPAAKGQPDHVKNLDKDPKNEDNGGVHGNSGIPNNAFALMTVGGTNDTSKIKVPSLGWADSGKLAWYTLRYNDRPQTQFFAHARWQVAMAKKSGMKIEPPTCAWVSVGVLEADYAKKRFDVTCEEDKAPDGGSPSSPGAPGAPGASSPTPIPDGGFEASKPPVVYGGCEHDLCATGTPLGPQCNDCTKKVCDVDPYCCTYYWGPSCWNKVEELCGVKCW